MNCRQVLRHRRSVSRGVLQSSIAAVALCLSAVRCFREVVTHKTFRRHDLPFPQSTCDERRQRLTLLAQAHNHLPLGAHMHTAQPRFTLDLAATVHATAAQGNISLACTFPVDQTSACSDPAPVDLSHTCAAAVLAAKTSKIHISIHEPCMRVKSWNSKWQRPAAGRLTKIFGYSSPDSGPEYPRDGRV